MKRLFKSLCFTFAALAFFCIASKSSEAATYARSPKRVSTFGWSTAISSVTSISVAQSTGTLDNTIPGAVYALYLSTGASGDFVVLLDTNSGSGYGTAINPASALLTNQLGPRYYFGSTSAGTTVTFDPPLLFTNGLMVWLSNQTDQVGVEFETGRGISGN